MELSEIISELETYARKNDSTAVVIVDGKGFSYGDRLSLLKTHAHLISDLAEKIQMPPTRVAMIITSLVAMRETSELYKQTYPSDKAIGLIEKNLIAVQLAANKIKAEEMK